MISDWKKRGASPPQDHHIFKLRTLEVEDPRTGKLYPRVTLDCPDWVNVIAVTADELIVLIRQFRFGAWASTLEIPGGMVDEGEDPGLAGARELQEETGYRAARLVRLGATDPNPALQNNRLHHYLATGCVRAHDPMPDESEDIEVELVTRSQLDAMVRDGRVSHSLVLAALHLWRLSGPG